MCGVVSAPRVSMFYEEPQYDDIEELPNETVQKL